MSAARAGGSCAAGLDRSRECHFEDAPGDHASIFRDRDRASRGFHRGRIRRRLADVNIRSIVAPTLSRYPTESQWEELEELLRRALSQTPRQTIPEALADEPALSVIDEWRHRHWLDESASFLP